MTWVNCQTLVGVAVDDFVEGLAVGKPLDRKRESDP
jgi:hypothetical protein